MAGAALEVPIQKWRSKESLPRQTRRLPVGITRFTYWCYEICVPSAGAELTRRARASQRQAHVIRGRFQQHLVGTCGEPGCTGYARNSASVPSGKAEIALLDYVDLTREWARDATAHRTLKGLSASAKTRIRQLSDRLYGRRGRRAWKTFLEAIVTDQRL